MEISRYRMSPVVQIALLLWQLGAAMAQNCAEHELVAGNATWKYDDTGMDVGTTWRLPSFDDGAWPAGAGSL